jgi:hypothetical protein
MLVTGGLIFAAGYVPSIFVAAYSNNDDDKALWAPVAGPWIDLATRDCGAICTSADTWNSIGLVASGVAQGTGVVLALASLAVPNKEGQHVAASTKPNARLAPLSFRGGAGMGAVGTF